MKLNVSGDNVKPELNHSILLVAVHVIMLLKGAIIFLKDQFKINAESVACNFFIIIIFVYHFK